MSRVCRACCFGLPLYGAKACEALVERSGLLRLAAGRSKIGEKFCALRFYGNENNALP